MQGERSDGVERWRSRIQTELLELSTGSIAVPDHNNGYGFHYRSHQVNLESCTCYVWFSIHISTTTTTTSTQQQEKEIVVMLDASHQIVIANHVLAEKGKKEQVVKLVDLYPLRPPRIQFISSGKDVLPKGSNIAHGDMMDWKWFHGGNFVDKWSPALRIQDATEFLAKSINDDYCRFSRPLPPKEVKKRGILEKICYFAVGCFCQDPKPTKDEKDLVAMAFLNLLDVPEVPQADTDTNHQEEGGEKGTDKKDSGGSSGQNLTTASRKHTKTLEKAAAPPTDVNEFYNTAVGQSLIVMAHDKQRDSSTWIEEEKQEIEEPIHQARTF